MVVEDQTKEEINNQIEQELTNTKFNIEEQASRWSRRKYEEKKRADMKKWRIGEFNKI